MIQWIKEMFLVMRQSIVLQIKNRYTLGLLVMSFLMLSFMLLCMGEVKEEKSKIYVGIANEDAGAFSDAVIAGMKQKDLYGIVTGEERDLLEKLKQGELSAVCIISDAFSEQISEGNTEKLVQIYETKEKSAPLLGDILAGVMMQEICTAKSYQTLISYQEKAGRGYTVSPEEYRDYVETVRKVSNAEFSFDIQYIKGSGQIVEKPSQAVVYEQAIFSVFALMTGCIAMYSSLPFWQNCHGKLANRLRTLPVRRGAVYAGSALAGFVLPMAFGILFLTGYAFRNRLDFMQIILLLICTVHYICVIVCMMLLAAAGIKNQTVYQMGILAMILVFGVFGLVSIVDGLFVPEGTGYWIPNAWYVRKITEVMQR